MDEKGTNLSYGTTFLLISTALFFDIFQFVINLIPVAGQIISILITGLAFMTFWLWFRIKGLKFNSPKRVLSMGLGTIIEAIPILNILPGWTISVLLIIGTTKIKKIAKIIPGGEKILDMTDKDQKVPVVKKINKVV